MFGSAQQQERTGAATSHHKFGDNVGGACGKTAQLLKTLLQKHSAMKGVVVREIHQFILRLNLAPKAVYNAIT
jgi:hypothetical protein